ncbi:helix-turn-helix domain-containing protein [Lactococcus lactis]|uniref:helix-turn-helix domain-containing protein n=1 Tax=Lactococcus lactis TaxID=1358 RepID=UPI0022DEE059|nr:helix-turn-helix transcriptional regulator [Lactococcus lactis]
MSVFAEQLKTLRRIKGLTQKELAEKVGVKQNSYSDWENGKSEPNIEMLVRLAECFDVSIDFLIGRQNQRK